MNARPRHTGNPFLPDGTRLKCHICKSEEHLKRWCPRNPDKGKSHPAPNLLAGLVTTLQWNSFEKVSIDEEYNDAPDVTCEGQKDAKFWMDFCSFDVNATASNYYVGKTRPEESDIDPEWYSERIELPEDSIEVAPTEIAFKEFMQTKVKSENPIPPFSLGSLKGVQLQIPPTVREVGTVTEASELPRPVQAPPPATVPPPITAPPRHVPAIPLQQEQAMQVEVGPDFKRQMSDTARMAVVQQPRPMPMGESVHHGADIMTFSRAQFKALSPPTRTQEPTAAQMEQISYAQCRSALRFDRKCSVIAAEPQFRNLRIDTAIWANGWRTNR